MSGHSRWAQIKHKKASADIKRGNLFSKLVRVISVAARGGADPAANNKLGLAIERARAANMPQENIDRAVKKAASSKDSNELFEVLYEAYGPGGSALLIEGITDNKNRAASEIKHILSARGGKLADAGSVLWLFDKKTVVHLKESENPSLKSHEAELRLIDTGAEDIEGADDGFFLTAPYETKEAVLSALRESGLAIGDVSDIFLAQNPIPRRSEAEAVDNLYETLLANDDVQSVWLNLEEK
jgi:YebC/PmpR family DNA-binding regulatory protein